MNERDREHADLEPLQVFEREPGSRRDSAVPDAVDEVYPIEVVPFSREQNPLTAFASEPKRPAAPPPVDAPMILHDIRPPREHRKRRVRKRRNVFYRSALLGSYALRRADRLRREVPSHAHAFRRAHVDPLGARVHERWESRTTRQMWFAAALAGLLLVSGATVATLNALRPWFASGGTDVRAAAPVTTVATTAAAPTPEERPAPLTEEVPVSNDAREPDAPEPTREAHAGAAHMRAETRRTDTARSAETTRGAEITPRVEKGSRLDTTRPVETTRRVETTRSVETASRAETPAATRGVAPTAAPQPRQAPPAVTAGPLPAVDSPEPASVAVNRVPSDVARPAAVLPAPPAPEPAIMASTTPAVVPAIAPPAASPAASAAPAVAAVAQPRAAIQSVLSRYAAALSALDTRGAKAVWPGVNERGLARAFANLHQQEIDLGDCSIWVTGLSAVAACEGTNRYTPKVGNRSMRSEARQWTFHLQQTGSEWWIESVDSR